MRSHFLGPLLIAALSCGLAATASAGDPEGAEPKPPRRLDREILLELGRASQEESSWNWITDGQLRLKGKGLQYRQKFEYNDRRMVFKLTGPRVQGGYGFVVQLEF